MRADGFTATSHGKLVAFEQGERSYKAFVPDRLPPRLDLDMNLLGALSDADRALGELRGVETTILEPAAIAGMFMRREAVLSVTLAGLRAGVPQLYAYEAREPRLFRRRHQVAPAENVRAALYYYQALELGRQRLENRPINLEMVQALHSCLLQDAPAEKIPGEFRRQQNWIASPLVSLEDTTYVPPPPPEMQQAMLKLEDYLQNNDAYPPLVRLALVHYQFEAIHPFVDGNGRMGRLLISLLLLKHGLLPYPFRYPWLCLSVYFQQHFADYDNYLLAVSKRGEWRDWILFFLRGVAEQARDDVRRVRELLELRSEWEQKIRRLRGGSHASSVIDLLFRKPVLTFLDIEAEVKQIRPDLFIRGLVDLGILERLDQEKESEPEQIDWGVGKEATEKNGKGGKKPGREQKMDARGLNPLYKSRQIFSILDW